VTGRSCSLCISAVVIGSYRGRVDGARAWRLQFYPTLINEAMIVGRRRLHRIQHAKPGAAQ